MIMDGDKCLCGWGAQCLSFQQNQYHPVAYLDNPVTLPETFNNRKDAEEKALQFCIDYLRNTNIQFFLWYQNEL